MSVPGRVFDVTDALQVLISRVFCINKICPKASKFVGVITFSNGLSPKF